MNLRYYSKFWTNFISPRQNFVTSSVRSVLDIDFKKLKEEGIELVVFDFDDTLAAFHSEQLPMDVLDLVNKLKKDFKIAVFSNCSIERNTILENMFSDLAIHNFEESDKPNPESYLKLLRRFNLKAENSAMIGDRIATDLFGAYLAGFKHRILIKPYSQVFGGRKSGVLDRLIKKVESVSYNLVFR